MIRVFCNQRGSGKSKELIKLANNNVDKIKGNSVFIDDNSKRMLNINSKIRFISMKEYPVTSCCEFSGFICGILANDYDIENIYIDNLLRIFRNKIDLKILSLYINDLNDLCEKYSVNVFINIDDEGDCVPEKLKKFIA